ncbi:MAG: ATP-dependent DNA ligase [Candidatus Thorarchaeota archaeon]|jgi:DNA ligase-1
MGDMLGTMTLFLELTKTMDMVSGTRSRKAKVGFIADFLKSVSFDEVQPSALFLSGQVFSEADPRTLNISWRGLIQALKQVIEYSDDDFGKHYDGDVGIAVERLLSLENHTRQVGLFSESLTITSVSNSLNEIAAADGKGSRKKKEAILAQLLRDADSKEARYMVAIILGDTRTGVSEGLIAEGVAEAFGIESKLIRRAWGFNGDIGKVAFIAARGGSDELTKVSIKVLRPMKPMLATSTDSIESLFEIDDPFALELKFDGARIQIHKAGDEVRLFSRRLVDVTESLPEIVKIVREDIQAHDVILDGEVVAVDKKGQPYPFQVVMKRFGRTKDIESTKEKVGLYLYVFDVLFVDGVPFVDEPYTIRRKKLEELVSSNLLTECIHTSDLKEALLFYAKSRELGHEGVMAKKTASRYEPGSRGKNWFKVKHTLDTLDLVIVAAEWGHGRRNKWLSDYHLAVLDESTGEYMMVGKTFKGLTDREFEEMTERLREIEIAQKRGLVKVQPKVVVEVLASEIQESPTYKSGLALRFARITRIRDDKTPEEATTLQQLRDVFEEQFSFKARS